MLSGTVRVNRRFLLAGGCLATGIVIAGGVWLLMNGSGERADPTDPQLVARGRSVCQAMRLMPRPRRRRGKV